MVKISINSFYLFLKVCIIISFIAVVNGYTKGNQCKYDNNDLNENYTNTAVPIKCNNNTCIINGEGVVFTKNIITITKSGSYVIEGSLNGQVIVKANKNDIIHIIMKNFNITYNLGPTLNILSSKKVIITLNNENTIINSNSDMNKKNNTCILSKEDITINGSGILNIMNSHGKPIIANKILKVITCDINVFSQELKGISAKSICYKNDSYIHFIENDFSNNNNNNDNEIKYTTKTVPTYYLETTNTIKTLKTINNNPHLIARFTPTTTARGRLPTTSTSKEFPTNELCSDAIRSMGYKCCQPGCKVTYVDKYGNWGIEKGQKCGCGNRF